VHYFTKDGGHHHITFTYFHGAYDNVGDVDVLGEFETIHRELLSRRKEIKMERDWTLADELVFAFNMIYTSSSWGDNERTHEGWIKKETALRERFIDVLETWEREKRSP